ncbi:hypothetical protein [Lentzea kentuckyensis]|uniref:hypothetical protein n=1 Tax=Lentzea kentuckyensis TaxID=360086 RepID=UPI000A368F2D|nr:hypothetical protein [Lentzea kentuckyensis]
MSARHKSSDNCLICRGEQEVVVGIEERGPHERMYDYKRVLFCAACDVGELRSFSYDDFVEFGEEDDVMVWSAVIVSADISRLRSDFACTSPLDHSCSCAQHVRAYDTCVRVDKTLLPEYGPDRHSPAGRTTVSVTVADGLVSFV